MKVAVYVRVSTQNQTNAQTIEQQIRRLQIHCESWQWQWSEVVVFRDEGYSGAILNRPGLDQLRDQVAKARFDRVLLTTPDRLARKYVHQVLLLEELQGNGCQVEFADRPMSDDPHDQLLLQIRGAVSEYERSLIVERTRRGRLQKLQAGVLLPWSRRPYGFQLDPDYPRDPAGLRVDPIEAELVKDIFRYYLEGGFTLGGVAKKLMDIGVPTLRGDKHWNPATVRNILTNPLYIGEIYANRYRPRPSQKRASPLKPVGKSGRHFVIAPEEQWLLVGTTTALVTKAEFELVKTKLGKGQALASRNNKTYQYLLRGMLSCGLCRLGCMGRRSGVNAYYTCRSKWHAIRSCRDETCPARFIPVKQLDQLIWADLSEVIKHPQIIALALERAHGGHWLPQALQTRRENLLKANANLRGQLDRLTEAYLAQVLNLEEYKRRRLEMEQRQQSLASQLAQLEGDVRQQQALNGMIDSVESFCARIAQGLKEATFEQQRQLVELLIDRVIVTYDQVEIRYIIPLTPKGEQTKFCHLRKDYLSLLLP